MAELKKSKTIVTSANVNLTNCDREQIHIPQSIQQHGVLVVLTEESLQIVQASHNSGEILGYHHQDLIGSHLSTLLEKEQVETIRDCFKKDFVAINPLLVTINEKIFDAIVHHNGKFIIVEFEPTDNKHNSDFISFYNMTRKSVDDIQATTNFQDLTNVIVKDIRQLTKFDRVLIYQFDRDGSGEVIAQSKRADVESFLGLHYPATDVPEPARRLYSLNYTRLIPDIDSQPVDLPPHPETKESFDLSFANLRSVSPIHVKYLRNMGVKASMSISIIYQNKLWGLIACHHYSSYYLSYQVRVACEFLAKIMSLNLIAQQQQENLAEKIHLQANSNKLFGYLSHKTDIREGLDENIDLLASLVEAEGFALCLSGKLTLFNQTPQKEQIKDLAQWLSQEINENIFSTDRLSEIYPLAEEFQVKGSGILFLLLNEVEQSYVIWFRPQVAQTVSWAGNPNKDTVVEADGSLTLSPRKSFALWKQNVMGRSLPWQQYEIAQVMEFRNLLVDIVFKNSNQLIELNTELEKSNAELNSFTYIASHDLKEPLRGIYNYSSILLEDYEEKLDENASKKLNTLMNLTKRMEKLIDALLYYSRLGKKDLNLESIDLEDIVMGDTKLIIEASQDKVVDIRMPEKVPTFMADKTLVEEVLMNLIVNGFKYNDKPDKWVEVGCIIDTQISSEPIFYVKDNGIGIEIEDQNIIFRIFKRLHSQRKYGGGTGAGLTIVQKIIERHGGKIWIESELEKETTFYFTFAEDKVLIESEQITEG